MYPQLQCEKIIREFSLASIYLEGAIVDVFIAKTVTHGVVCIQLVSRKLPTANCMPRQISPMITPAQEPIAGVRMV
jgi:hypothetical protein